MARFLQLRLLGGRFAVCRLAPDQELPRWVQSGGELISVTRTATELSVVCPEEAPPDGVQREAGWRAFEVEGPLSFALTGVLASIAGPLAEADVSIFSLSTYDTDYVLVKGTQLDAAVRALEAAGHTVDRPTHGFV